MNTLNMDNVAFIGKNFPKWLATDLGVPDIFVF